MPCVLAAMQCAAFLAGLLNSRLGKRALVIAPKVCCLDSSMSHWWIGLDALAAESLMSPVLP